MSLGNKDFGRSRQTYSAEEIDANLKELSRREGELITERKQINKQLKDVRDSIKYYQELDPRQTKLF